MPKEVRYLLFSHDEILRALLEDAERAMPGRRASPDDYRLTIDANGGAVVARVMLRAQGGSAMRQDVAGSGLMAVVLRICQRERIPMPLRGRKRLEAAEGGLALTVAL